jgi:hypothetical protein
VKAPAQQAMPIEAYVFVRQWSIYLRDALLRHGYPMFLIYAGSMISFGGGVPSSRSLDQVTLLAGMRTLVSMNKLQLWVILIQTGFLRNKKISMSRLILPATD